MLWKGDLSPLLNKYWPVFSNFFKSVLISYFLIFTQCLCVCIFLIIFFFPHFFLSPPPKTQLLDNWAHDFIYSHKRICDLNFHFFHVIKFSVCLSLSLFVFFSPASILFPSLLILYVICLYASFLYSNYSHLQKWVFFTLHKVSLVSGSQK